MEDKEANKEKRTRLLVLPVVSLGIAYLLLLGYLLWGKSLGLTSATAASLTPTPVDLWKTYEQARVAARTEAPDAQLVSASTQWQTVSEDALLEGAGSWTLVFYSPQSSQVLDVVVNDDVARVLNRTQAWVVPLALTEDNWRTGPRDALAAFLACGGRTFLDEHPEAVVDLHLTEDSGGGAVWSIVALDLGSHAVLSVVVDAETALVVSDSL